MPGISFLEICNTDFRDNLPVLTTQELQFQGTIQQRISKLHKAVQKMAITETSQNAGTRRH